MDSHQSEILAIALLQSMMAISGFQYILQPDLGVSREDPSTWFNISPKHTVTFTVYNRAGFLITVVVQMAQKVFNQKQEICVSPFTVNAQ